MNEIKETISSTMIKDKNVHYWKAGGVLNKHKALSSSPSTAKKEGKNGHYFKDGNLPQIDL
jgi:hypothetical protein